MEEEFDTSAGESNVFFLSKSVDPKLVVFLGSTILEGCT
jgi:hypothetical protein